MNFSDLHIHILSGVDDGPKTEVDMYAMQTPPMPVRQGSFVPRLIFTRAISETISKDLKKPLPGCLTM